MPRVHRGVGGGGDPCMVTGHWAHRGGPNLEIGGWSPSCVSTDPFLVESPLFCVIVSRILSFGRHLSCVWILLNPWLTRRLSLSLQTKELPSREDNGRILPHPIKRDSEDDDNMDKTGKDVNNDEMIYGCNLQ